jgi:hypothetical protein
MTMELILNIAWAVFSLTLIVLWMKSSASDRIPRRVQILALAMTVLLLLPVISLSDDLQAMQGPSETDTCLRRVLHSDDTHPSVFPVSPAFPEAIVTEIMLVGFSQEALQIDRPAPPTTLLTRSLDSRPPPAQA